MKTTLALVLVAGMAGCAAEEAGRSAAALETDPTQERAAFEWSRAPFAARTLAQRLRARHTHDLPEQVDPVAARWVAEHDPAMVVRGRALSLLRDTTPETRALVASILASPESHPILLCGALEASRAFAGDAEMAGWRDTLRDHADPRVRHASRAR